MGAKTEQKPLVSVVVAVYNVEPYLDLCMKSVLGQDYPEMEVILVDDGSTDASGELCDKYASKDDRVRVIHQSNCGLWYVRNVGLDNAYGDYIVNVDADDCLEEKTTISLMVDRALSTDADIVQGSYRRFVDLDNISGVNLHHLNDVDTDSLEFRYRGFYQFGHLSYQWGKLYKKEFLLKHDIRNNNYPFTQDKPFNMRCLAAGAKYAFLNESVYLYRVNEGSVTFKYKKNYGKIWAMIASDFDDWRAQRNIKADYGDLAAFHILFGSFFIVKQEQNGPHKISRGTKALKEYRQNDYVFTVMRNLARGKYVNQISNLSWRFVIKLFAKLFTLGALGFLSFGMFMLRFVRVDKAITDSRYRK